MLVYKTLQFVLAHTDLIGNFNLKHYTQSDGLRTKGR